MTHVTIAPLLPPSSCSDKVIAILERTHDGDDLSPTHLYLLQLTVNHQLNDAGKEEFIKIYNQVMTGEYQPPWFHDIEHLTINHEGYVLWKNIIVEHYESPWAYSEEAKTDAIDLARRCQILESKGITPTNKTAIWEWVDEP